MTMNLTPAQYEAIERTMPTKIAVKIGGHFAQALDAGHDLFDPATGLSPAGEVVMAAMVADARAIGFGPETVSMLRWNVRAYGRRLILNAFADLVGA